MASRNIYLFSFIARLHAASLLLKYIEFNRGQPLGCGVRVILPQCVLSRIRQQYPDPHGQYTGFQPAHEHV